MKIKPISPKNVSDIIEIPNEIIEIVNNFIKENWNGKEAIIYQKDLVNEYIKLPGAKFKTEDKIIDNGFLDFEKLYRDIGWKVIYESPDRGEASFNSYFKFTKK